MKQITCPHCGDTYPDFDAAHVCSKGPYAPKLKPKMNERIKQLVEQAQYYANEQNDKHGVSWIRTYNEKFAELIVKECMTQIQQVREIKAGHAGPEYTQGFDDGMFVAISTIEEHFGVEE